MKVLADGVVSEAEQETLKRLQNQFRLSDQEVQSMVDEYNKNKETQA